VPVLGGHSPARPRGTLWSKPAAGYAKSGRGLTAKGEIMAETETRELLEELRLNDVLRRLCDINELKRSGSKGDVIERLVSHYGPRVSDVVADLRKKDLTEILSEYKEWAEENGFDLAYYGSWDREDQEEMLLSILRAPEESEDGEGDAEDEDVWLDEDGLGPDTPPSYEPHDVIRVAEVDRTERCDVELAEFQRQAVAALDESLSNGRRAGLVAIPTGGGKTRTALDWLFARYINQGQRVLWVTHRLDLLDQVHDEIRGLAFLADGREEITVSRYDGVGGGRHETSGDFVLASAASLVSRAPRAADFSRGGKSLGVVVYDEAHGFAANKRRKALKKILGRSDTRLLGLTATPFRSSAAGTELLLEDFEGEPVFEISFADLIRVGFLATPEFSHQRLRSTEALELTTEEIEEMQVMGEVPWSVLSKLARHTGRSEEIVDHWCANQQRYGKTVAFACTIEHATRLARMFEERGVPARAVHYQLDRPERHAALRWFKQASGPSVIVNVGLLTEGWNVPDTRTVLMARPTMSNVLYVQMIGRGSRGPKVVPGKTSFHVIDCVDNFARHGLTLAGARIAALLQDDAAQDRRETLPTSAPSTRGALTPRQQDALDDAAETLALRGLDLSHYKLWGELRWTTPTGATRSVAVFGASRPLLEEALSELKAALHGDADWDEVADLGIELDDMGALRCLEWDDIVDDAAATNNLPELVPIEIDQAALDRATSRAQLIASVLEDARSTDPGWVANRCIELATEQAAEVANAFGDAAQLIAAVHRADTREKASQDRERRRPQVDAAPLDAAVDLALAVAACDGDLAPAEERVAGVCLSRLYGAADLRAQVSTRAEAWRRGEQQVTPDEAAALLAPRPYQERLLLMDALFRISAADGLLDINERQLLQATASRLRVPAEVVEEYFTWWRDAGASRAPVDGYVTCGSCGTTWVSDARFCGECGTQLRAEAGA
jgi:superfamily II DNA or RNA helicase/uncharacterized tellurite resistance protein B-like protein